MKPRTLRKAAPDLSPNERAGPARRLAPSLGDPSNQELAEAWLSEAGRRRAGEIDRGEVEPVSAEEVRLKARALLR